MSHMPPLPDASDIGLIVGPQRLMTPQWLVHDAVEGKHSVIAWRYLPHHLREEQDGSECWPLLFERAEALKLGNPDADFIPQAVRYSPSSRSGWLIYPRTSTMTPGRLPAQRLIDLAVHLCYALKGLHAFNILHLDVHRSNIFETGGRFQLMGMGLDLRMATGMRFGSNEGLARRHYAPPETWDASGRSLLGPWTDIFGAAATLYNAATGNDPPDFRSRLQDPKWKERLSNELQVALKGSGDLGRQLEQVILRGLEPAIADRPRDVAEWARPVALAGAASNATASPSSRPSKPVIPQPTTPAAATSGRPDASSRSMFGWLQNVGVAVLGTAIGMAAVALYILFVAGAALRWGHGHNWLASEGYDIVLACTLFQVLSLFVLLPARRAKVFRTWYVLPGLGLMGYATWSQWSIEAGWIDWFNILALLLFLPGLGEDEDDLLIGAGIWSFLLLLVSTFCAVTGISSGSTIVPAVTQFFGL